jgi:hypothetical protein
MSGTIQTAPNTVPGAVADWENELNLRELSMRGYDGVSLTEWEAANTDKPSIAAGSVIEINGALCKYAVEEALTDEGGLADGWCYIKHVVAGLNVTPTLTNTFGTWDAAKNGFYDGNNRYSLFAMYRSGAVTKIFSYKGVITLGQNNSVYNMTLLNGNTRKKAVIKTFSMGGTQGELFTALNLEIPSPGDVLMIKHTDRTRIQSTSSPFLTADNLYIANYITRHDATTMRIIYGLFQTFIDPADPNYEASLLSDGGIKVITQGSASSPRLPGTPGPGTPLLYWESFLE